MLLAVAQDDVASFKNNNRWLAHHPKDALLFRYTQTVWARLRRTYGADFKGLVYGAFPSDAAVLATLIMIQERLSSLAWAVNFENK